jgi:hypothetical protein
LVEVLFNITNPLTLITSLFGGNLAQDVNQLAGDGSIWRCGVITPLTLTSRRRLLQLYTTPTATVTMYTVTPFLAGPASTAANDFTTHLQRANLTSGLYIAPNSGAQIPVTSLIVFRCPDGAVIAAGQNCSTSVVVVDDSSSSGLSGGAIAGIVVGAVVGALLCLLCLALCLYFSSRRDDSVSEPSSAEASRIKAAPLAAPAPIRPAGGLAGMAGLAGAATTAPEVSGEESQYREYHTPPAEISEVDPDQSSQLHIHV